LPGTCTSETSSRTSCRSGVATSSAINSGILRSLQGGGALQHLFDGALHVERLLGHVVVLALGDLAEAPDGIGELDVLAGEAGELLGHVERLRKEALDFARARYRQLVFVGKLVDA